MNIVGQQHIRRAGARLAQTAGYTLVEITVAFAVITMIGAGFIGFIVTTTRMTQGIVKQGVMNHQAGNGVEIMLQRIRVANSMQVDAVGENLTLTLDDNNASDSDGDGINYNDTDHTEIFQFRYAAGKTQQPLVGTNYVDWIDNSSGKTRTLFSGVRQLTNLDVFALTNGDATAVINFGLADPYVKDENQNVEIRVQATRRNHK
jgi:hypothetical protein